MRKRYRDAKLALLLAALAWVTGEQTLVFDVVHLYYIDHEVTQVFAVPLAAYLEEDPVEWRERLIRQGNLPLPKKLGGGQLPKTGGPPWTLVAWFWRQRWLTSEHYQKSWLAAMN